MQTPPCWYVKQVLFDSTTQVRSLVECISKNFQLNLCEFCTTVSIICSFDHIYRIVRGMLRESPGVQGCNFFLLWKLQMHISQRLMNLMFYLVLTFTKKRPILFHWYTHLLSHFLGLFWSKSHVSYYLILSICLYNIRTL